jgi:hypothetical protein
MDTGMESRPNRRRGGITLRTRPRAMLERCQSAGRFAEGMQLCWVVIGEAKWMVGERALAAFLMHTPRRYLFSRTAAGHSVFDLGTRGTKPHASSKAFPSSLAKSPRRDEQERHRDSGMDASLRARCPNAFCTSNDVFHQECNFHLQDARRLAGTNAGNQQQVVLPISIEGADNCVEALYGSIH